MTPKRLSISTPDKGLNRARVYVAMNRAFTKSILCFLMCLLFAGGLEAAEEAAGLGSGLVVWESNRQGVWRIYSNTLDGKQGEKQISPEEIAAEHRLYRSLFPARTSRAERVKAEPVRSSHFPSLEEIAPYRDALVNTEFRTEDGRLIYVICRAFANGEKVYDYEPGRWYSLLLEPLEDNPQAEGVYTSDTLGFDPEIKQYFNAGQCMEE